MSKAIQVVCGKCGTPNKVKVRDIEIVKALQEENRYLKEHLLNQHKSLKHAHLFHTLLHDPNVDWMQG